MTALFIDRSDADISLCGELLSVTVGKKSTNVPCAPIERLIVRSPARIDTAVLTRLWSQNAGVLILSGQEAEAAVRYLGQPHTDCTRRLAQLRLQTGCSASLDIGRRIVRRKLDAESAALIAMARRRQGMAWSVLAYHECMAGLRSGLRLADDLEALRGAQCISSAAYYSALMEGFDPALGFRGRCRAPSPDPVNLCLSLGYMLLGFEAARQIQIAGLDPMLGVIHDSACGSDSLACDLIEPLRPRLDLAVFGCFTDGVLQAEHFHRDDRGHCVMSAAGHRIFHDTVERHMPLWSRWLRRAARAYVRLLPSPPPPERGSKGGFASYTATTLH